MFNLQMHIVHIIGIDYKLNAFCILSFCRDNKYLFE